MPPHAVHSGLDPPLPFPSSTSPLILLLLPAPPEPASPGPDSEATMEVDNSDVNSEGSQSMEDPEEPSTPDDKIFYIEGSCLDGEKDEETVKAIR